MEHDRLHTLYVVKGSDSSKQLTSLPAFFTLGFNDCMGLVAKVHSLTTQL